uniref:Uncharacterized protein n=1 Tax=Arcella intermedia TaxID=1963864 RepID=A0A6B2LCM8_9EUKA
MELRRLEDEILEKELEEIAQRSETFVRERELLEKKKEEIIERLKQDKITKQQKILNIWEMKNMKRGEKLLIEELQKRVLEATSLVEEMVGIVKEGEQKDEVEIDFSILEIIDRARQEKSVLEVEVQQVEGRIEQIKSAKERLKEDIKQIKEAKQIMVQEVEALKKEIIGKQMMIDQFVHQRMFEMNFIIEKGRKESEILAFGGLEIERMATGLLTEEVLEKERKEEEEKKLEKERLEKERKDKEVTVQNVPLGAISFRCDKCGTVISLDLALTHTL